MAGILANSATQTMVIGNTAADNTFGTFVTDEQITLATTPTGSTYVWGVSRPSGATGRSALSSSTDAAPVFTPDVPGLWVLTCVVDSTTTYVLRTTVVQVAIVTSQQAFRCLPIADASVPSPAAGEMLYFSSTVGRYRTRTSAGGIRDLDPGARTGTVTLSGGAGAIADTSVTASTVVAMMLTGAVALGTPSYIVTPGVGVAIASTSGADASTYRYALIG